MWEKTLLLSDGVYNTLTVCQYIEQRYYLNYEFNFIKWDWLWF